MMVWQKYVFFAQVIEAVPFTASKPVLPPRQAWAFAFCKVSKPTAHSNLNLALQMRTFSTEIV